MGLKMVSRATPFLFNNSSRNILVSENAGRRPTVGIEWELHEKCVGITWGLYRKYLRIAWELYAPGWWTPDKNKSHKEAFNNQKHENWVI